MSSSPEFLAWKAQFNKEVAERRARENQEWARENQQRAHNREENARRRNAHAKVMGYKNGIPGRGNITNKNIEAYAGMVSQRPPGGNFAVSRRNRRFRRHNTRRTRRN
jgi:hypothetical protein